MVQSFWRFNEICLQITRCDRSEQTFHEGRGLLRLSFLVISRWRFDTIGSAPLLRIGMSIRLNPDLERRITAKVKSGRYQSPAEVVQASLELLEARDAAVQKVPDVVARPVWETVAELGQEVSQEEWAQVPSDLARDLDRHLYGAAKIAG
jgi:putative addiction module CopG family antidote